MNVSTKPCPCCGEIIKSAAVKCRYCYSEIGEVVACPFCSELIPKYSKCCPECGNDLSQPADVNDRDKLAADIKNEYSIDSSSKRDSSLRYVAYAFMVVMGLFILWIIYLGIFSKNEEYLSNTQQPADVKKSNDIPRDVAKARQSGTLFKNYTCTADLTANNPNMCVEYCKPTGGFSAIFVDITNRTVSVHNVDKDGFLKGSQNIVSIYKSCDIENESQFACEAKVKNNKGSYRFSNIKMTNGHFYYHSPTDYIGCAIKKLN